jgi:hypothetical protein
MSVGLARVMEEHPEPVRVRGLARTKDRMLGHRIATDLPGESDHVGKPEGDILQVNHLGGRIREVEPGL